MKIWELIIIAVGLAMDAFAAALCQGVKMKKYNVKHALIISLFFGGFQAVMPLIGWLLGRQLSVYIVNIDHWIAFALLSIIGIKMVIDSFKKSTEVQDEIHKLNFKDITLMSLATSIDALAVGITFALLSTKIISAVSIIGIITFAICMAGVFMGSKIGGKLKNKAELLGGIVLILIGLKILLEHLNILSF